MKSTACPEKADPSRRDGGSVVATESGVTLQCCNITKSFGGVRALDCVTADFEAGKVTALVGPNGAGKTTLFHVIAGTLKPDSGHVFLKGRRIDGLSPWQVARLGVGRLFQDVRVFRKLSALDNLLVANNSHPGEGLLRAVLGGKAAVEVERRARTEAQRLLQLVGLEEHEGVPAEELSFGQQKLLSIARLLAARANVFLLDEPTAGVNPQLVTRLLEVVRSLALEGHTVVIIEHNMSVVLDAADWVFFLDEGQIAAFGSPQEVIGDRAVRAAYLGL